MREIHRQLFADVYEWAGSYRIVELRLGDEVFVRQSSVRRMVDRVEAAARALVSRDAERRDDELADGLARLYAEYNYVHPFREGNGRTGTLMLHIVATLRGRRLDLSAISREEWYAASHNSMPLRRDGESNAAPFAPLLGRALG